VNQVIFYCSVKISLALKMKARGLSESLAILTKKVYNIISVKSTNFTKNIKYLTLQVS
jgi:hypothetical protein